MQRVFLFLQGVASPFFPRLADRLISRGHRVCRVNFCAGDAMLWGRRQAYNYRGKREDLTLFYQNVFAAEGVTDVVLFGDERPIHRPAITLARETRREVHVFEEGYLRPDWFTLERGGVNANSSLLRDPDWYLSKRQDLSPTPSKPAPGGLKSRALYDMAFHLANVFNPFAYPGYRTHRPYSALVEYLGWAKRFAPLPLHRLRDARVIDKTISSAAPFYVLPLQLNADTQIICHSPFRNMSDVLDRVMTSFAGHAPDATRLVIKNHPLDTGLQPYKRVIGDLAKRLGIADRVDYIETGHLPTLLANAAGVVVVNSTVGLSALHHRCATIALGDAIYDLPGLTFQGPLDAFWSDAPECDRSLLAVFSQVLRELTQINGNLYTDKGITMALDACVARMEAAPKALVESQSVSRRKASLDGATSLPAVPATT